MLSIKCMGSIITVDVIMLLGSTESNSLGSDDRRRSTGRPVCPRYCPYWTSTLPVAAAAVSSVAVWSMAVEAMSWRVSWRPSTSA